MCTGAIRQKALPSPLGRAILYYYMRAEILRITPPRIIKIININIIHIDKIIK